MFGGGIFEPEDDKKEHEASCPLGCADPGSRGRVYFSLLHVEKGSNVEMNIDIIVDMDMDMNMNLIV